MKLNEDDRTIGEFTMDTIELAKIVKNAIIYLIRLVKVHENFKYKKFGRRSYTRVKCRYN